MTKIKRRPRNPGPLDAILAAPNYDAQTISLLHFHGVHASNQIQDDIMDKQWTAFGLAQIDTSQTFFGLACCYFDGTNSYLLGNNHADFAFGTGDFTIDFRVRFVALSAVSNSLLIDFREAVNGLYPMIQVDTAFKLNYFTNSANRITGATTLVINTWYHIAVARSGTNTKLFLNGVQEGSTYVDSNNYIVGPSRPAIGARGLLPITFYTSGRMDEIRFSKGIARWTANFTPPAAQYAPP